MAGRMSCHIWSELSGALSSLVGGWKVLWWAAAGSGVHFQLSVWGEGSLGVCHDQDIIECGILFSEIVCQSQFGQ